MHYTISQVAKKTGLTPFTIRYYDKEGLLKLHRTEGGIRYFTEVDLDQLRMVCCLKSSGMPIKEIKRYFDFCRQGDETMEQRMEIFKSHKETILRQIQELYKHLAVIDKKIHWYQGCMEEKQAEQMVQSAKKM